VIVNYVITFISAAAGYLAAAWFHQWRIRRELDRLLPDFVELKDYEGMEPPTTRTRKLV
jgi:hypothetical protein